MISRVKAGDPTAVKFRDAVFAEYNNPKGVHWKFGQVDEDLSERNKCFEFVRVKTSSFELIRPIQRLAPWKCHHNGLKGILWKR
ncbi:hypothetical protein NPIL_349771 [Nephila pilipes]|uniref:Uncharacterized protein n=1 Tax=Nephila pilipes TaxID=299642 RepID=A0A8X6PN79_NEPPI|nr:hypothetical protein NPIL_349771 [Nephila pilipes]